MSHSARKKFRRIVVEPGSRIEREIGKTEREKKASWFWDGR